MTGAGTAACSCCCWVLPLSRAAHQAASGYALTQAAVASRLGLTIMHHTAECSEAQALNNGCVLLQHAYFFHGLSGPRLGEQHVTRVPMQEGEHEDAPASVWQAKACRAHEGSINMPDK